jgi:threonine dehydratase
MFSWPSANCATSGYQPKKVDGVIEKQDLLDCLNRIAPHIHRTPVMTSRMFNQMVGASIVFKCENFQRMGAFKMRGAMNAILCLSGLVTSPAVRHTAIANTVRIASQTIPSMCQNHSQTVTPQ